MTRAHDRHLALHRKTQAVNVVEDSIQNSTAALPDQVFEADLVRRAPASETTHCTGSCALPTSSRENTTLPIVLGAVIPIVCAVVVLIFLHRRSVKKRRLEDATYKHGSLDFGLGEGSRPGRKGRKGPPPEMTISPPTAGELMRPSRGVSMDMGSPYVLPGELQENRPSFHSLSRSNNDEDPYHVIGLVKSRSTSPNPPYESSFIDAASAKTGSSGESGPFQSFKSSTTLLPNGPSRSSSMKQSSTQSPTSPVDRNLPPVPTIEMPKQAVTRKPLVSPPVEAPDTSVSPPPRSNSSLPTSPPPEITISSQMDTDYDHTAPIPRRESSKALEPNSLSAAQPSSAPHSTVFDEYSTYADVLGIVQKETFSPPMIHEPEHASEHDVLDHYSGETDGLGVQNVAYDNRRLSVRPLPPEDPNDNAEQRANRIRSFYKEYFDDSKGGQDDYGLQDYWEDYGQEYLEDATIYDPVSGQFIVAGAPYQEPITRRAMTPPPRGPPRMRGPGGPRGPVAPLGARFRAHSSASGRPPTGGRGRPQKRPLPPPKPLKNLPTPHLLKDDAAIFSAADFAPPEIFKHQREGRPASPLGGQRPYSPSVRAHTPLMSSFDDLPAMPSPHLLRKSSTFTALDFAPPPRIKADGASDAGSIRSGRSNASARHVHNIRTGAYRVSRLPADTVGTAADLAASLKPQWQQRAHDA